MQICINEATPRQLDWLAAKARTIAACKNAPEMADKLVRLIDPEQMGSATSDWAIAGPIKTLKGIAVRQHSGSGKWYAMLSSDLGDEPGAQWVEFTMKNVPKTASTSRKCRFEGPTELIACIRCYCASELGDVVDIPKELCGNPITLTDENDQPGEIETSNSPGNF